MSLNLSALQRLGWNSFFAAQISDDDRAAGLVPARVAEENRGFYRILAESASWQAELAGRLRHDAVTREELPAVGDWVLAKSRPGEDRAIIHRVLPRRTVFSRKVAGKKVEEQIVAANVDTILLVTALNRDFNLRRIERYLSVAWDSGARPVVILNKSDLAENAASLRNEAESVALGVRILVTSATRGDGLDGLRDLIRDAGTTALLGSSGVGKSTLINAILGEDRLATADVRESDDRGRHTTTSRQLTLVPGGGVLIDTPGMRELQLWDTSSGLEHAFADIEDLAARCKFRDCTHNAEPGCAVRAAINDAALDAARLDNFHKLEREEEFLASKKDLSLRVQRNKAVKKIMKAQKELYQRRNRERK